MGNVCGAPKAATDKDGKGVGGTSPNKMKGMPSSNYE